MSQMKISQEDKADIMNGECHYFPLSKENMLVISGAPVRCTKIYTPCGVTTYSFRCIIAVTVKRKWC
jgi:hypothetical protein